MTQSFLQPAESLPGIAMITNSQTRIGGAASADRRRVAADSAVEFVYPRNQQRDVEVCRLA